MRYMHRHWRFFSLSIAAVVLVACARTTTTLHVRNDSATDVTNVVLTGHGFRVTTPSLRAGERKDVSIVFQGESDLAVSFVANGRSVSSPGQGYFEGNGAYTGDVVIKPDLSVSVTFGLLTYE